MYDMTDYCTKLCVNKNGTEHEKCLKLMEKWESAMFVAY